MAKRFIEKSLGIGYKNSKKTLAFTITYDNQLLSLWGEVERQPWRDRQDLAYDCYRFCNKVSLTIQNKGSMPIDTDICKQPLSFNLDVGGKLENAPMLEKGWDIPGVELLNVIPVNPRLGLDIRDGQVLLSHVRLEPAQSLQLVFLGYFRVNSEELG